MKDCRVYHQPGGFTWKDTSIKFNGDMKLFSFSTSSSLPYLFSIGFPPFCSTTTKQNVAVPESVLKKRKAIEKLRAQAEVAKTQAKKAATIKRREMFKRAESNLNEYRAMEREQIRLRRLAKATGSY